LASSWDKEEEGQDRDMLVRVNGIINVERKRISGKKKEESGRSGGSE
jgi:hypothetical protein